MYAKNGYLASADNLFPAKIAISLQITDTLFKIAFKELAAYMLELLTQEICGI